MWFSSAFFALLASSLVFAAPSRFYGKRNGPDILVFKFAEVLEQLESAFYDLALQKFKDPDFTAAGFTSSQIPIEQFTAIQADEAAHSTALRAALKALGQSPIEGCQFNFDAALKDVATMAATARVIENVGVSAYLGGATLLTDPVILQAAGSILTIEARHQSILNVISGTGSAIPSAFDFGFAPNEVLALAGPFISGCDTGIPANTPLTVTNTDPVGPGTLLTFSAPTINGTIPEDQLFCQMLVGGAATTLPFPVSDCVVPDGINGPVGIFITSDGQPLINNVRDRDQTKIVAGPTLAFIDIKPEVLGQLVRNPGAAGGNGTDAPAATSTTTRTISPAEASSIILSATATPTPPANPGNTDASADSPPPPPPPPAGGKNDYKGKSADGKTTVNGWSNVPVLA
jgi:hypothetical protein